MELKQLQSEVDSWIKEVGVRYYGELTNMAILTEEVGELASLVARVYGEQSFKQEISQKEKEQRIEEEIADVLFVVTCLANQMNIDLESAIKKSMEKKTKRDKDRHHSNNKLA